MEEIETEITDILARVEVQIDVTTTEGEVVEVETRIPQDGSILTVQAKDQCIYEICPQLRRISIRKMQW